jgi:hypothetical protein
MFLVERLWTLFMSWKIEPKRFYELDDTYKKNTLMLKLV